MSAERPVDRIRKPEGWAYDRRIAHSLSRCAKCGERVNTDEMFDIDAREYRISALCPDCFASIFPDEEDCE